MIKNLLTSLVLCLAFSGLYGQSVGIIGSATPGGWDTDTDMVLTDPVDSIWTIELELFDGEAKFRQDDDWIVNWGSSDFPLGVGEQDGANIPVFAGSYMITFNAKTGEYNFDVDSDIGIIGSSTPGGWDTDSDMFKDQTDSNKFFTTIDLIAGEAKFRKDDDWAVNWGSADFPSGVGTQDGDNILVDQAATYMVTLDTSTGEYLFESMVTYETIGIIGDATPGGWEVDTDMTKSANDPNAWSVTITLTDGEVKFRAEDDWPINWGGTDFPSGTAELGGDNIPVTAGDYLVSFNSETGEYSFTEIVEYSTVGIIGDATPGGWAEDTDFEKDAENVHLWTARLELLDGEAKFRAEDDWPINWGSGDFPVGVGVLDGANIPITAGEYIISFNSLTGEYNFKAVVEYGTVGLIGKSGPNGDWENDVPMEKDADDFNLWTLESVTLTTQNPDVTDEGVKFRAENDWAVNWGDVTWPSGIGTAGGPNIATVEGTYGVTFNSSTGEYLFGDPLTSTQDIINPSEIKVFPNPATQVLNINLDAIELNGDVNINVIDMTGKVILQDVRDASQINSINISNLNSGNYLLNIYNDRYIIGKRFSVVK